VLDVSGLTVRHGAFTAVEDATLTVRAGEIVALLGANGAGKSTTLRAILGLVRPDAGTIRFEGTEIGGLPAHARVRRGLALVPEGRELFPAMTVDENLDLGWTGGGEPAASLRARVRELFPVLAERRRQLAGTLSGGEQQMLAIGRALMAGPRLLMLDEPSLGLAPRAVDALYDALAALSLNGLAMLLVEQHVGEALALAHRGYVMASGRIELEGPAPALRENDDVRRAYLVV
jgi:branched-chain amino acid transport system ATP-binding protein